MKGYKIITPPVDLSSYALKSEITTVSSNLSALTTKFNNKELQFYQTTIPASGWALDNIINTAYDSVWRFDRYASSTPTLSYCQNATPNSTTYRADSAMNANVNVADSYTGRFSTYAYFSSAKTVTLTIRTDDEGNVYLNGNHLMNTPSCTDCSTSFAFLKGWNKIDIVFTEGAGDDGVKITPLLNTVAEKIYAEGTYGYSQTLTCTPVSNSVAITTGSTYTWLPFLIPDGGSADKNNEARRLIESLIASTVTVPSNGKIKISNLMYYPTSNHTVYWLCKKI